MSLSGRQDTPESSRASTSMEKKDPKPSAD